MDSSIILCYNQKVIQEDIYPDATNTKYRISISFLGLKVKYKLRGIYEI